MALKNWTEDFQVKLCQQEIIRLDLLVQSLIRVRQCIFVLLVYYLYLKEYFCLSFIIAQLFVTIVICDNYFMINLSYNSVLHREA